MGLCLAHLVWSSSHVASRLKSRPAAAAWERADPAKPMEFALPLFAVQCLANGQWLVRTQMGDPILPVVDVVVVVGAQTDIRRDPESAAAEAASAQVISSMRDSAQVTSSGAINSMIAAMSTRPNRQNRSTCSRISVPIAHMRWRANASHSRPLCRQPDFARPSRGLGAYKRAKTQ